MVDRRVRRRVDTQKARAGATQRRVRRVSLPLTTEHRCEEVRNTKPDVKRAQKMICSVHKIPNSTQVPTFATAALPNSRNTSMRLGFQRQHNVVICCLSQRRTQIRQSFFRSGEWLPPTVHIKFRSSASRPTVTSVASS